MKTTVEEGKPIAIISYILIVGVLIAMSMNSENKNPFAAFHIRQAAGLSVTFISLGLLVSSFDSPAITISMYIFVTVLWCFGIFNAIKGETTPIPLLGKFFQTMFKSI